MRAKLMVALLAPLLMGGCMMAGMAGMAGMGHMAGSETHGTNSAAAPDAATIVKQVNVGGLRVTAEFPAQAAGESLRYVVTISDRDGRVVAGDAALFLEVSPVHPPNANASPMASHTGHPLPAVQAPLDDVTRTRFMPAARDAEQYIFRPDIASAGTYRLAVVVERVGDTRLDPAIVVEHVVTLAPKAPATSARSHAMWAEQITPLVLLGAGFMALMMLVAIR